MAPEGFIIYYYFELRGILERIKQKTKKILIYTPYNENFTKYICADIKDLDILIKTARKNINIDEDRYILSLFPDIPANGIVKFTYFRPPLIKYDLIEIYELKCNDIQKLSKMSRLISIDSIDNDRAEKYILKMREAECLFCYEKKNNILIIDCCGGNTICASCALKYNKCPICKNQRDKFIKFSANTDINDINVMDIIKYDKSKFIKMAEYGNIKYEKPEENIKVLKTILHPCETEHYEYDYILTSSPLFNIYNLRINLLASIGRKTNLVIIAI